MKHHDNGEKEPEKSLLEVRKTRDVPPSNRFFPEQKPDETIRMPTIAYMVPDFPCLSETFIVREIKEMIDRGFHVKVYAVRRPEKGKEEKTMCTAEMLSRFTYGRPDCIFKHFLINIRSILNRPIRYIRSLLIFLKEINQLNPLDYSRLLYHFYCGVGFSDACLRSGVTHIHSHFTTGSNMALAAGAVSGIPFSFTAHASSDIFIKPVLLEAKMSNAAFVAAVCEYSRGYLDAITGFRYTNKLYRVYNGIALTESESLLGFEFEKISGKRPMTDTAVIVSVGRLIGCKGHATLLKACRVLKDRGRRIRCDIVGEGPERPVLLSLIAKLGLQDIAFIHGDQSIKEVYRFLGNADIFALLCEIHVGGYRDGFPTVILEAMHMSLPVVSTWISGVPEMVVHGKTGLLVLERDVESAADALDKLLGDWQLRSAYGEAGKQRVIEKFNITQQMNILSDLLMLSADTKR